MSIRSIVEGVIEGKDNIKEAVDPKDNKFYVTSANDYYCYNQEVGAWDWASDRDSFEVTTKDHGTFDTYEEARNMFDTIELGSAAGDDTLTKSIDDDITGQLADETLYEDTRPTFKPEYSEDLQFTLDEYEKAGIEFK